MSLNIFSLNNISSTNILSKTYKDVYQIMTHFKTKERFIKTTSKVYQKTYNRRLISSLKLPTQLWHMLENNYKGTPAYSITNKTHCSRNPVLVVIYQVPPSRKKGPGLSWAKVSSETLTSFKRLQLFSAWKCAFWTCITNNNYMWIWNLMFITYLHIPDT